MPWQCHEQHYLLESLPLIFDFLLFYSILCKSGSGTGTVMLSGSAEAKSYGSCDSGSTTLGRGYGKVFCTFGRENFNLDWEFYLGPP